MNWYLQGMLRKNWTETCYSQLQVWLYLREIRTPNFAHAYFWSVSVMSAYLRWVFFSFIACLLGMSHPEGYRVLCISHWEQRPKLCPMLAGSSDHLCAGYLMLSVMALFHWVTFSVKQFPFSGVHSLCMSDVGVHLNNVLLWVNVLPKGSVWSLCTCYDSVVIMEEKIWASRSHIWSLPSNSETLSNH